MDVSREDRNNKSEILERKLISIHKELVNHEVYTKIFNKHNLRIFMGYHVFTVWDSMSLIKSLQNRVSCTLVPWKPSTYPKELIQFVNRLVLDEESGYDQHNRPCDHFSLYVRAMEELYCDTKPIKKFLKDIDYDLLENPIKEFIQFNVNIATSYPLHIIAGVYYFGRERIVPHLLRPIAHQLDHSSWGELAPTLRHYLSLHEPRQRDGRVPSSFQLLHYACMGSAKAYNEALSYGIQTCLLRKKIWDKAYEKMDETITEPLPQSLM
ncbi:MAG: DUF3050 domain-containing protein [Pseudobacteriovorax sp.]|nr:DUF3050 domain-containing protein [Pseudobacteriovorax sp.]